MKTIIALLLLSATATAQTLTINLPEPVATGEQITSAEITFRAPLLEISKPFISTEDGRFGRLIRENDVSVRVLNQDGSPVSYNAPVIFSEYWDDNATMRRELRITGQQLDAAGVELDIEWVTCTGVNQLRVEMRAALRAILSSLLAEPVLTGTIVQIEAGLLAQLGLIGD
jgi:hypothetical protein